MAAQAPTQRDVGRTLRGARQRRHVQIEDAATTTRIQRRYLEALESNAPLDAYPAPMYARAFLREYARYLNIDPEPLVERFGRARPGEIRLDSVPEALPAPRRWPARVILAISIGGLVALAAVGILGAGSDLQGGVRPGIPTAPAVVHHTPGRPGATVITVGVHVLGRTWIRVIADGRPMLRRTLHHNWHRFSASAALGLIVGRPNEVRVLLDGKPIRVGPPGRTASLAFELRKGRVHVRRA
jgi:hypothetical protein